MKKGKPPWRIWVGDVAKWIEACAYTLAVRPDARLAKRVDEVVAEIAKGQKPDGYLYANPLPKKWRWANLEAWHEFYDLGHLIEAAVALYQATGQRTLLDVVWRAADLVEKNFGWEKGKRRGYDGHEEIELALVRLYHETGEPRYLKLAKFFVDVRGTRPNYFEQEGRKAAKLGIPHGGWFARNNLEGCQAHRPVREQTDAVGHAVRAMYLYSGIADVAAETGDRKLLAACQTALAKRRPAADVHPRRCRLEPRTARRSPMTTTCPTKWPTRRPAQVSPWSSSPIECSRSRRTANTRT